MFSSLMPRRREFFELPDAHSDRVVASANPTLRLVHGLGAGGWDIAALVAEVLSNDKSTDEVTSSRITLLPVDDTIQPRPDPHPGAGHLPRERRAAKRHHQCRDVTVTVTAIADIAAVVIRVAVTQLFATEGDKQVAWHAMKMHGFYFAQQAKVDSGQRAARTPGEMLLETA